MKKIKRPKSNRFSIFLFPLLLTVVGLLFVFESSSVMGFSQFGDSFYFLKLQAVWTALSVAAMIFFAYFDYHKLYYLAFPLMIITIILLVLVLVPGVGTVSGGARRWIDLGVINFQPTEVAKFSVIVYLSSWFLYKERKRFFSFIALLGFLVFLIILQPDMGTAIIVFSLSIIIYFLAGIQLGYLVGFIPIALLGFIFLIQVSPYRFRRITAFFNPSSDPLGIGYHINQILISLSNGGLLGQGFGASRQKYLFLPEAHTDSIFAIIAEEFGFVGSFLLIFVFFVLVYKIYEVAVNAPDRFGKFLASGIFAYFGLQLIINLSGMVNLLPLTGVPLPFISYGGSNLIVSFSLIGILLNISRKTRRA